MAQVNATIAGRQFRLACEDGQEEHLQTLAKDLDERIEGLRCIDCGRLEMSRTTESLTALLISVNSRYKIHAGIRLSGLTDGLWD